MSVPYDMYRNLVHDFELECEIEELHNSNIKKEEILFQKVKLIRQMDALINKKEKENSRLRKLLRENNISF